MKSDRSGSVQYAALPWRQGPAGLEILLLTSRETRRWVLPKGWPMIGVEPQDCAAEEAFEEAGVEGVVTPRPIGAYPYRKRLFLGLWRRARVTAIARVAAPARAARNARLADRHAVRRR